MQLKKQLMLLSLKMNPNLPLDLDERIKKYLVENNEEWDSCKHHIFVDSKLQILVIDQWDYKCNLPSSKDLEIPKILILK